MDEIDLEKRSQMATALRTNQQSIQVQPLLSFPSGLAPRPDKTGHEFLATARNRVIVMVDTAAEVAALAAVFTPGILAAAWHPYIKDFYRIQDDLTDHSPARRSHRLGSYCFGAIGNDCCYMAYKTELHMHEDGPKLPLKQVLQQLIDEFKPTHFLTTGTSGGVYSDLGLGGVVVTHGAQFHCKREFAASPFNNKRYQSPSWNINRKYIAAAEASAKELVGHLSVYEPPRSSCASATVAPPRFKFCASPVLTTDYFEFGTTTNGLDKIGCCVEMDDAVLGLACSELKHPPKWACVRNVSDPIINGALTPSQQDSCAEFYYQKYGFWTTINSSLAAWSIIAGME